jgi:predicted ATPase
MLTRIYIDNFRCYSNFELSIDQLYLLLGANGAGKSSLFEALTKLQALLDGVRVEGIFLPADLTRWTTLKTHRFELDVVSNGDAYRYQVGLRFQENQSQPVVVDYERLWLNDQPLLQFEAGTVQLHRDDFTLDATYPLDRSLSAVGLVPPYRRENSKIHQFRQSLNKIIVVQLVPPAMTSDSEREAPLLDLKSSNFVSWYRWISKDQGLVVRLTQQLQQVLPGFSHFLWLSFSEQRQALIVKFVTQGATFDYAFHQLSDGQRMLIGLYTLLLYAESNGVTLCIDEPENFLALPEIQPWLHQLYDFCGEKSLQALIISHHPELIDYLAASHGIWLERKDNGTIRIQKIVQQEEGGLPISELVARGWIYAS